MLHTLCLGVLFMRFGSRDNLVWVLCSLHLSATHIGSGFSVHCVWVLCTLSLCASLIGFGCCALWVCMLCVLDLGALQISLGGSPIGFWYSVY